MQFKLPPSVRILGWLVGLALGLAAGVALFGFCWMKAGLARVDGRLPLPGLSAAVTVERDGLGTPTVRGESRLDVARAEGFLHAQDRFFQMDLLRRHAAGELAELFGRAALDADKAVRLHEFRHQAQALLAGLAPADRAIVEAYTAGVNAGLHDLKARPFEYLVLRSAPRDWAPEDSLLVAYAMVLNFEDHTGKYKRTLAALTSAYGFIGVDFFAPYQTPADATMDGSVGKAAPIPDATVIDLHERPEAGDPARPEGPLFAGDREQDRTYAGSNNLAIAGSHAGGPAIVGSDMHLGLSVPNTWYRASLVWPGHKVTGTTLPGIPFVLAGSNGQIAWGWTIAYADMGDLVSIQTELTADMYYGMDHKTLIRLENRSSTINVKGSDPVKVDYSWSLWGPIVSDNGKGRLFAYNWVFDHPGGLDLTMGRLETAASVDEAMTIVKHAALPSMNLVVGDAQGHVGWTVSGAIPQRYGFTGRTPVAFAYGDRGWNGVIADADRPAVVDPAAGYVWTANARAIGGAPLAAMGDGGFGWPARSAQLKGDIDELLKQGRPVKPADILAIQLDDRALFLADWRQILLQALSGLPESGAAERQAVRDIVANHWEGRASVDCVSYRLVRAFRLAVAHRVFDPIYEKPISREDVADWTRTNYEAPLRQILAARPLNLLSYAYGSWDDLLLKSVDDVVADLKKAGLAPAEATWGRRNTAAIRHPFALVLPKWLVGWLAMPADPLPGDSDMPRVQSVAYGASERFAVAPGREDQGIFEMPCGESANPVSPYYRAGHEAWVHGEPTPFLPGAAEHTLILAAAKN